MDRELAEAALAHQVAGVEAAYFRSDLFDRRRSLMEAWGRFATSKPGSLLKQKTVASGGEATAKLKRSPQEEV